MATLNRARVCTIGTQEDMIRLCRTLLDNCQWFDEPEDNQSTLTLEQLDEAALMRILTEPKNAITKQYQKLFELDGVELKFEQDAVKEIAAKALERKTGARGLRAIIEKAMLNVMYQVPSDDTIGSVVITREAVLGEGEPKYIYREDEVVERNNRRRKVRSNRNEIA